MAYIPGSPEQTSATLVPSAADCTARSALTISAPIGERSTFWDPSRRDEHRSMYISYPIINSAFSIAWVAAGVRCIASPGPIPTTERDPRLRTRLATAIVAWSPICFSVSSSAPGPPATSAAASATLGVPTAFFTIWLGFGVSTLESSSAV